MAKIGSSYTRPYLSKYIKQRDSQTNVVIVIHKLNCPLFCYITHTTACFLGWHKLSSPTKELRGSSYRWQGLSKYTEQGDDGSDRPNSKKFGYGLYYFGISYMLQLTTWTDTQKSSLICVSDGRTYQNTQNKEVKANIGQIVKKIVYGLYYFVIS